MSGFMNRLDGPLEWITHQLKQGWAARVVMMILVFGSLAVIWWSINERLELLYGAKAIIHQQADVQREIDQFEMKWASQNHEKIAADLTIAERKLMPNQNAMAEFLEQYIAEAQNQRIQLIYNVGRPHPTAERLGNIYLVPIQIILRPSRSLKQRDAYKRIVAFAKKITGSQWRMDVTSASVTGRSGQFDQLEMFTEIWMAGDIEKILNPAVAGAY